MTSDYEGLPLSVIEAMAAGVPVISTKAGGVVELIQNQENGILVDVDDDTSTILGTYLTMYNYLFQDIYIQVDDYYEVTGITVYGEEEGMVDSYGDVANVTVSGDFEVVTKTSVEKFDKVIVATGSEHEILDKLGVKYKTFTPSLMALKTKQNTLLKKLSLLFYFQQLLFGLHHTLHGDGDLLILKVEIQKMSL